MLVKYFFHLANIFFVYLPDLPKKIHWTIHGSVGWNIPILDPRPIGWSGELCLPNPRFPRNFEWVSYVWSLQVVIFWATWLGLACRAWMDGCRSRGALKHPSIQPFPAMLPGGLKNLKSLDPQPTTTGDKHFFQFSEGANASLPIQSFTFHCYSATITHCPLVGLPGLTLAFWSKIENSTVTGWGFTQTLSIRTCLILFTVIARKNMAYYDVIHSRRVLVIDNNPCLDSKRPLKQVGPISHHQQQQKLIVHRCFYIGLPQKHT